MFQRICVLLSLVLSVFVVNHAAQAAIMRADVPDSEYQAFAANTATFDPVGCLFFKENGNWNTASAVLIDDGAGTAGSSWLLAAGHSTLNGNADFRVYFGNAIYESYKSMAIADAVYTYPGYTGGWGGDTWDIALIHLSQSVTDITPATIASVGAQPGDLVTLAGFGTPTTALDGTLGSFDGVKRAGENRIDSRGSPIFLDGEQYLVTRFGPIWHEETLPLELGTTPGDSGGGWFNANGELIGITDYGRGAYSSSGAIDVTLCKSWIDSTIHAVPEPASIVILGTGALTLLPAAYRRRRRQRSE